MCLGAASTAASPFPAKSVSSFAPLGLDPLSTTSFTGVESSTTDTLDCHLECSGHKGKVLDVSFSADGKLMATGGSDETRIWDATTGATLHELPTRMACGVALFHPPAASEYHHILASGSVDNTINLWDACTGQLCFTAQASDSVLTLAVSSNGSRMVVGHQDSGDVTLWSLDPSGKAAHLDHVFAGHTGWVWSVVIDDDIIASASDDDTVKVWSVSQQTMTHTFDLRVVSMALHGSVLVCACADNACKLIDVHSGSTASYQGPDDHYKGLQTVAVSGNHVVLGTEAGSVLVCSLQTGELLCECPNAHGGGTQCVAIRGTTIVSGSHDSSIKLWKVG